jgi:hypothetical protein
VVTGAGFLYPPYTANIDNMRKLFLIAIAILFAHHGYCQANADPATGQIDITNTGGVPENLTALALNKEVVLKVPVFNFSQSDALPTGSCLLRIRLGNNMAIAAGFNLATAPLTTYFTWASAIIAGGETEITGTLIAPLPEDFIGVAEFNVMGNSIGTSIINCNFQVTNASLLTDEDPGNNISTLQYTVTSTLPVTFTGMAVQQSGCSIKLGFSTGAEINVERYEIQLGSDGINYDIKGQLPASQRINYNYTLGLSANIKSPLLYIRIKAVDKDGRVQFSEAKTLKVSACNSGMIISAYPNPLTSKQNTVTVRADNGSWNGEFAISLCSINGTLISSKKITLTNATQFLYATGYLAAGQYILKIQGDNMEPEILKIQQL